MSTNFYLKALIVLLIVFLFPWLLLLPIALMVYRLWMRQEEVKDKVVSFIKEEELFEERR